MIDQDSQNPEDDSVNDSEIISYHKIIFIGNLLVGKSAIISVICGISFINETTMGVDFITKNIKFRGQNIKLQIWDTNGSQRIKGILPSCIHNSSLIFLVYDISNRDSFNEIPNWISFIRSIKETNIVLCGNKTDLIKYREVKKEEGEALAQKEGLIFFEVSALNGYGIKNMFYNSIAELFMLDETNSNKENIVNELMEENDEEYILEGFKPCEEEKNSTQNIIIKKENIQVKNRKINKRRKCLCLC